MRSRNGQRKQPTSYEDSQHKAAVKPQGDAGVPSPIPAQVGENSRGDKNDLLERVLERENLFRALKQVRKNGGAPGIDGMKVDELPDYLKTNWVAIKGQILTGAYRPSPVKRVEIPKPGGGARRLGIPTVLDRLIQQALLQEMPLIFDTEFSPYSYGFRPGKRAHDAVKQAQTYIQEGYRWGVDMDLEKFFGAPG